MTDQTIDLMSVCKLSAGVLRTMIYLWQREAPADPMAAGDVDVSQVRKCLHQISIETGWSARRIQAHLVTLTNAGWIYERHGREWLCRAVVTWPIQGDKARVGRVVTARTGNPARTKDAQAELEMWKTLQACDGWVTRAVDESKLTTKRGVDAIERLRALGLVRLQTCNLSLIPWRLKRISLPERPGSFRGARGVRVELRFDSRLLQEIERDAR